MSSAQPQSFSNGHQIDLDRLILVNTSNSERSAFTGVYGALSKELKLPHVAGDSEELKDFRQMAIEQFEFVFGSRIDQIQAGEDLPRYPRLAIVGGLPVVAGV